MSKPQQLFETCLRVHRKDSVFVYFILEAVEGICFYSTLETPKDVPYRLISIQAHESTKEVLLQTLEHIRRNCDAEFFERIPNTELMDSDFLHSTHAHPQASSQSTRP